MSRAGRIIVVFVALVASLSRAAWAGDVAPRTVDATPFIDATLPDCGIQKALDSLKGEAGVVQLPEGPFALARSLMMPSNATLQGKGSDKTTLTSRFTNQWVKITAADKAKLTLESVPKGLRPGSSIFAVATKPFNGWWGAIEPLLVKSIDGNVIECDLWATRLNTTGKGDIGWVDFGLQSVLTKDVLKGDGELHVADASIFIVGQSVIVGSGDGNANESLSFIKAINGNTIALERPIRIDQKIVASGPWKRVSVWSIFPLITSEDAHDYAIKDLAVVSSIPPDQRVKQDRYTASLIHLWNGTHATIENVAARDSHSDGISVQGGSDIVVRHCLVANSSGNGFHPGTGVARILFDNNTAKNNGAGLYFCWSVHDSTFTHNTFSENRGGGITGLGNPRDENNLIAENMIERNGGAGIQINGGPRSRNVIRKNTIRDNSTNAPGKFPGIYIDAATEDARFYTIENNTIESTSAKPTQLVGIAEHNGLYGKTPTFADDNTIRNNRFAGHMTADILVVGKTTKVDNGSAKVVVEQSPPATQPAK